jgi:N-acetylmuramoyl-L-alanine amidase
LVETGYLTNQQEERYLNSSKGQDQVVSNIMTAFRQYMKQTTTPKGNAIRRE